MSPVQMVATALQETWEVFTPTEVAAALTMASLSEVFTGQPALVLNQFAYSAQEGTP